MSFPSLTHFTIFVSFFFQCLGLFFLVVAAEDISPSLSLSLLLCYSCHTFSNFFFCLVELLLLCFCWVLFYCFMEIWVCFHILYFILSLFLTFKNGVWFNFSLPRFFFLPLGLNCCVFPFCFLGGLLGGENVFFRYFW